MRQAGCALVPVGIDTGSKPEQMATPAGKTGNGLKSAGSKAAEGLVLQAPSSSQYQLQGGGGTSCGGSLDCALYLIALTWGDSTAS